MSYIGNEPIISATRTITEVLATAGQTVFTANGGYTVGYLDVFVNGVQLQTSDYTASNGSTVTLGAPCALNDDVRLVAWGTFSTSNLNGNSLVDGSVTQAKLASGVAGNGPAFSAYQSTAQTALSASTFTKLLFQTELYDTNAVYDTAASRFTANIAGYYQFNAAFVAQTSYTYGQIALYKNGTIAKLGNSNGWNTNNANSWTVSSLVYLNGTTDYVEVYGLMEVSQTPSTGAAYTYFDGFLARAA